MTKEEKLSEYIDSNLDCFPIEISDKETDAIWSWKEKNYDSDGMAKDIIKFLNK